MTTPNNSDRPDDATFRTRRILLHPPGRVFQAFARPELLARWWGPAGFTNTFEVFEFRPRGRWKFIMHGPDGTDYPNENVFEHIDEAFGIGIRHVSAPHFTLTVTLSPHESGTEIRWVQAFDDAGVAARIRHIVEPANEQNLDRLAAVLSEGAARA